MFELDVVVPVPDMTDLDGGSLWPDVEARIVDLIELTAERNFDMYETTGDGNIRRARSR